MIPLHNDFILSLCFINSISSCFGDRVRNKLTGKEFSVVNVSDKSVPDHGLYTIRDVPDFLDVELLELRKEYHLVRVPQYTGYLIDLKGFEDIEDYISKNLSRNPRKNLRAKIRKLEANHEISYSFYFGHIEKTQYDYLFGVCFDLMRERFVEKKIHNRYLLDWNYYFDLFYPKILKKEASLFVIYDKKKPITLTLNFHKADIVFSFIQIYDTKYFRYSLGDTAMYKNLDWCFRNNFRIWDMSKGATDNKLRWSNHHYRFDYLLFYSRRSIKARILAIKASSLLRTKQLLRDKGIIGGYFQMDRVLYYLNRKKLENHDWKNS